MCSSLGKKKGESGWLQITKPVLELSQSFLSIFESVIPQFFWSLSLFNLYYVVGCLHANMSSVTYCVDAESCVHYIVVLLC